MNKTYLFCVSLFWTCLSLSSVLYGQNVSGVWETSFAADDGNYGLTLQFDPDDIELSSYSMLFSSSIGSAFAGDQIQTVSQAQNNLTFELGFGLSFSGNVVNSRSITGTISYQDEDYPVEIVKIDDDIGEITLDSSFSSLNPSGFARRDTGDQEKPVISVLILFAVFWAVVGILLRTVFKGKSRKQNADTTSAVDPADEVLFNRDLPLVRLGRKMGEKKRGLVLLAGSLFFFKKNKKDPLTELHDATQREEIRQYKKIRKVTEFSNDEVDHIYIEKTNRKGWSAIRVCAKKQTARLTLPSYEIPNLTAALRAQFPGKITEDAEISFHSWGLLIAAFIFSLVFTSMLVLSGLEITNTSTGLIVENSNPFFYGLVSLGVLLLFFSVPLVLGVLEYLPEKSKRHEQKKSITNLSHRQPFRSRSMSLLLKLASISIVVLFITLKTTAFGTSVSELFSPETEVAPQTLLQSLGAIPWYFIYGFVGLLLSISYSLAQKDPNKLKGNKAEKPILYLRSFGDDRETTLNIRSARSTFLGVNPPYYFLEKFELAARSKINRISKQLIRYAYRFHPLFLIRLMFSNPKETSEQQLGHYLKRFGYFVAIGKPGEKIVTPGASRLYVTDEEWKQTVLDLMSESELVVLQPSRTDGVWWEVEQVFSKAAPGKILLCMVNYFGFQNDYENFKARMEALHPDRPALPNSIGNERRIVFLGFSENWEPRQYTLQNYWSISWLFRGTTANLAKTLKPFMENRKAENPAS